MRLLRALALLLCLCGLQGTEGKKESSAERQGARTGRDKAVPSSGELMSKENHRCTWETSGEAQVTLLIRCSYGNRAYWCRFAGRPDLCPAYAARSSQYWKQAVGRLKKRRNACDGEEVLKTRVCKKAPVESNMRLEEKSGEEEEGGEGRKSGEEGGQGRKSGEEEEGGQGRKSGEGGQGRKSGEEEEGGQGRKSGEGGQGRKSGEEGGQGRKSGQEEGGQGRKSREEEEGGQGRKSGEEGGQGRKSGRGGGRKPEPGREGGEKERDGFQEVNDGIMEMAPVENYCAEGWQSFCSFFVKFIDG